MTAKGSKETGDLNSLPVKQSHPDPGAAGDMRLLGTRSLGTAESGWRDTAVYLVYWAGTKQRRALQPCVWVLKS